MLHPVNDRRALDSDLIDLASRSAVEADERLPCRAEGIKWPAPLSSGGAPRSGWTEAPVSFQGRADDAELVHSRPATAVKPDDNLASSAIVLVWTAASSTPAGKNPCINGGDLDGIGSFADLLRGEDARIGGSGRFLRDTGRQDYAREQQGCAPPNAVMLHETPKQDALSCVYVGIIQPSSRRPDRWEVLRSRQLAPATTRAFARMSPGQTKASVVDTIVRAGGGRSEGHSPLSDASTTVQR